MYDRVCILGDLFNWSTTTFAEGQLVKIASAFFQPLQAECSRRLDAGLPMMPAFQQAGALVPADPHVGVTDLGRLRPGSAPGALR